MVPRIERNRDNHGRFAKNMAKNDDKSLPIKHNMKVRGDTAAWTRDSEAGFNFSYGQNIPQSEYTRAVRRNPIAQRVTYIVAKDVFDKWFTVEPLNPDEDKKFNIKVQQELARLDARWAFTLACTFERVYGWSIIVVGYVDSAETVGQKVKNPTEIHTLMPYGPLQIPTVTEETNPDSERYGLPVSYYIQRSGTAENLRVHYTRVLQEVPFATRMTEHPYKGMSILEPIFDDLTALANVTWSAGQTMYRIGPGFPDVTLIGAKKKQIDDFRASNQFKDIFAKSYFVHNENQEINFKGAQGVSLDPTQYAQLFYDNISAGTGIPLAMLRGAQAGALAGSEVNEREYFKEVISPTQLEYTWAIRELIDRLIEIGQIKTSVKEYELKWAGGFEVNELDRARTDLLREQAAVLELKYKTVDEVRKKRGLDPLPNGEGNKLSPQVAEKFPQETQQAKMNPELL